jgi:hypothetical protein
MRHPRDVNSLPSLVSLTNLDAPHIMPLIENMSAAFNPGIHPNDRPRPLIDCLVCAPPYDIKPVTVLNHLSSRLILSCTKRKEQGILRYYRSDTFFHLRRILRTTWLASLFGPTLEWTFPFQGGWISFQPPEIPDRRLIPVFWNVDGPTRDRIFGIEYVNTVIGQFESEVEDALGVPHRWPDIAAHDRAAAIAERSLARAASYGLLDNDSQILFAVHALHHGEHFHLHLAIQYLLETRGERSYQEITDRLTPEQWKQIASPYC